MRTSRSVAAMLIALISFFATTKAYDFTNLNLSNFTNDDVAAEKGLADVGPFDTTGHHGEEEQVASSTTSPNQTPMHWILSRLYGGGNNGSTLHNTERRKTYNETQPADVVIDQPSKAKDGNVAQTKDEQRNEVDPTLDEEAIRYNVSYLGLKDPFARYSTRLSYDYSIDISEPHDNRRGSMLSLLNGTVFPFGSVGAMMALGWSGGTNDSSHHKHSHYDPAKMGSNGGNRSTSGDSNSSGHSPTSDTSQPHSSLKPHGEGLSGVWLAFTSQHAVTGGYTLHSSRVSATNNVVFHNVTFRSNITIDAQGHFTFSFTMGTVDESDQDDGLSAAANGTHSSSYLNMFDQQDSHAERQRVREERRRRGAKPTWLDGPRCVELDPITNNTEATFRMRCEGNKIDLNEA